MKVFSRLFLGFLGLVFVLLVDPAQRHIHRWAMSTILHSKGPPWSRSMREFIGQLSLSLFFMAVARIPSAEATMTRHEAARNSHSSSMSTDPGTLPADKDNSKYINGMNT